jgi:hypothetical protein
MKKVLNGLILMGILFFASNCDEPTIEPEKSIPEISTTAVTDISQVSAVSGGTIVSNGNADITASGICWSTNAVPTIADNKTEDGTTSGSFASTMTGLDAETMYYVCAYATNSEGTGYGNILSFTTEELFLASTEAQNRTALLEDFTGVRCGYCPQGHIIANQLHDMYPDQFIAIAVHTGYYAQPASGWPNFTTPYGNILVNSARISGYPSGTMNRIKAADLGQSPQQSGGMAMSRNHWQGAAEAVMQMSAPVNIGAMATYNESTRELSVQVDLYYTADGGASNYINVALLQDKIMSRQSGAPDPSNYEQNHVLRDLLTGQWGNKNTETTAGTKYSKTYTYSVPTNYNGLGTEGGGAVVIDNLKVVVFVCESGKNVLNAVEVDVE